jgi:FMN reductase (NADPH)
MISNPVIETMLNRKSIRQYRDEPPTDEVVKTIVRAGQQAPFAYQLCSLLLSRHQEENPYGAPLLFTICVDSHRLELVMAQRNWRIVINDLSLLLFGIQDASLMAENMVIAAESLGLGRGIPQKCRGLHDDTG